MKKRTLLILVCGAMSVCVLLFSLFYNEARKTAVERLNEEQMIHAKQAARGIEEFFMTWTGILTSIAGMDDIISNNADGRLFMGLLHEAHKEQIRSITRVDEKGTIIYTVPHSLSMGSDISGQRHVREILKEHKPVVSEVFKTVQGFDGVALHVPVFKGALFKGTIAIVVNFESLAKRYLEVIRVGETGSAWVVSRDGTQLYSPTPGVTGKSAFVNYQEFPSIISMVQDMVKGHQGTATYTVNKTGGQTVSPGVKHAVYMPIRLGNTFWSIVVATSENEVLSHLSSLRNRLLLVVSVIFIGGILFSIIAVKAWVVVAEEEKRKRIEQELRAGEQRYRLLFERNPAPMLIYERGTLKMLAVNEAFTEHYGYTSAQALSMRLTDLYPEDEKALITDLAASLKGSAYVGEWHHLKADGSIITIVARSHDIDYLAHDARMAVISDVTERKRTEDALRHSEEKFFKAFHATPDAIVISRAADGLLLEVNDVFLAESGYSREETLNKTAPELNLWAEPEDRERYSAAVKERGRVRDMEARFRTKSGGILYGLVSGEGIVLNNEVCLLTIIRNITERKKTEEELTRYRLHLEDMVAVRTSELSAANTKLKELDRLKSMFIASMSHELRTPLNSIIGFTGMTLQGMSGELNGEQKDNLNRAYFSAKHLLDLITDVIDISKIEAGRVEAYPEEFLLREAVDDAVATIGPQLKDKGLTLDVDVLPDIQLYTDRKRLLQCLLNFLSNAVKFAESGRITVASRSDDGEVSLSVGDTGIGIAEKDIPRLFEPFERLETHLKVKAGGTGLGLYLTKKLVTDVLRGSISVQSTEGRGSTFTIRIPGDIRADQVVIGKGGGDIL